MGRLSACGARRHGRDGRPHRPRVGKPAPASASCGRAFYASVYSSVSAHRLPLSALRRRTAQDDFCRTGEETAFGFSLRACIPHKNFISVSSVRRARALLSRAAVTSLRRFALSLRRRTAPRTGLRPRAGWLRLRAGCAHASRGLRLAAPHGRRGGIPPAGGFYSLCRGCTSYSHYSILRTAPRPLSYSAIKQWPGGCGFILSLWPTFVNP